jgi:hypothetical protein
MQKGREIRWRWLGGRLAGEAGVRKSLDLHEIGRDERNGGF